MRQNESGNVIFYILIAVGLLAALSYTVAGSLRGGGDAIMKQGQDLNASAILEYANTLGSAVTQIRLRGVEDVQVSFENALVDIYGNKNCEEPGCKIFNAEGGGVTYALPKPEWLDPKQKEQLQFGTLYISAAARVKDIGSEAGDLILFIPYVKKELCRTINKQLGIEGSDLGIPKETNGPVGMESPFIGVFEARVETEIAGSQMVEQPAGVTNLTAKSSGCAESSGTGVTPPSGTYHFYQVLVAR